MTTRTTISAAAATRSRWPLAAGPAHQALLLLRTVFTIAPILFGLDKFFNLLTDWPNYLAPWVDGIVPGTAQQAMYAVGIIEIVAGVFVALKPRWGSLVVVLWLAGIIVNLLILGDFYDVALRDFGLLIGALALSRLALLPRPESSASSS
jgi:uncharacterized membrane protein YphA (DoxX/SURF4 family)